jgi:hypothetical protein
LKIGKTIHSINVIIFASQIPPRPPRQRNSTEFVLFDYIS